MQDLVVALVAFEIGTEVAPDERLGKLEAVARQDFRNPDDNAREERQFLPHVVELFDNLQ